MKITAEVLFYVYKRTDPEELKSFFLGENKEYGHTIIESDYLCSNPYNDSGSDLDNFIYEDDIIETLQFLTESKDLKDGNYFYYVEFEAKGYVSHSLDGDEYDIDYELIYHRAEFMGNDKKEVADDECEDWGKEKKDDSICGW